jgi:hypothetical protein
MSDWWDNLLKGNSKNDQRQMANYFTLFGTHGKKGTGAFSRAIG